MPRGSLPSMAALSDGLEPRGEARHDHNDRDLHGALHRHHAQIGFHPARHLLRIGLRLLYFEIEPDIGRQQIAKPLHREHGDDSERGDEPPEFGIGRDPAASNIRVGVTMRTYRDAEDLYG